MSRTNWLQRWNKETRRFEAIDVSELMALMVIRDALKAVRNWDKGWRQKGLKAVQYYEDNNRQNPSS